MKHGRLIRKWIGFIIILAGWCILAWPYFTGKIGAIEQTKSYTTAQEEMIRKQAMSSAGDTGEGEADSESEDSKSTDSDSTEEGNSPAESSSLEEASSSESGTLSESSSESGSVNTGDFTASVDSYYQDALYQACLSYNENLIATKQANLTSTAATEQFAINTTSYGFSENVIGTLWVPRMGVKLALYLGANSSNMASGAAIFGETSVPMSQGSVNCAIAGHRGWCGIPMFRNIQSMQIGDPIYIQTPWEGLVYRVTDIRIVLPEDDNWCLIEEGKNKVSLMTCHPYTASTYRYIVIGELTDETIPPEPEAEEENQATYDPSPKTVEEYDAEGNVTEVTVDATAIKPDSTEYGAYWQDDDVTEEGAVRSNFIILAEDKMEIVMFALLALLLVMLIWLIRKTRREFAGNRKEEGKE